MTSGFTWKRNHPKKTMTNLVGKNPYRTAWKTTMLLFFLCVISSIVVFVVVVEAAPASSEPYIAFWSDSFPTTSLEYDTEKESPQK